MLSLYKEIANVRIIDDQSQLAFDNEVRTIERAHSISPISDMDETECSKLEYHLIAKYDKTLAMIYECYDKLLGLNIVDIQESEVKSTIAKMDPHARSIFLSLAGVPSAYNVVPAVVVASYNTKHFLSRYNQLVDMKPTNCCTLI